MKLFNHLLLAALTITFVGQSGFAGQSTADVSISNPSFEGAYNPVTDDKGQVIGAVANGWANNGYYGDVSAVYAQDTTNPHSGLSCQRISLSAVRSGNLQLLQGVAIKAGIYTISAWMRGVAGSSAGLTLQGSAPSYQQLLNAPAQLTGEWQQFTTQGYVTADGAGDIIIGMNQPGTVYVDDVTISYQPGTLGPTPNVGAIPPTFFGMHVAHYSEGVFVNGGMEPPFRAVGVSGNAISGDVASTWMDNSSWANVNVTYAEDTNNPHGGKAAQQVNVQAVTSGAVELQQPMAVTPGASYTMTAWVRGQAGMNLNMILLNQNPPYNTYASTPLTTLTSEWQQFSVTGQVSDTGEVNIMFNAGGPGTFSVDDVTFTTASGGVVTGGVPWPAKPFSTLRLWDSDTTWSLLEPQKGIWNFRNLDRWVASARGKDIILTLGQSPTWASSNPSVQTYYGSGASAPPSNIQDWTNYVTKVAKRYKGRIRFFEIWNEPNDQYFYSGTVQQMAELTRTASEALKAVDPGITVILSPAYSAGYVDELLGLGAGQYVDVIGYHAYATPPEETGRQLGNVRLVMAKYNFSQKPLWDTEAASGDTTTTEPTATSYMVRKYLTDLAFGAGRLDWYTWGPATPYCVGTEQSNPHLLTGAAMAYGYLHDWLTGAYLNQATIDAAGNWQIGLTLSSGKQGLIVWNPAANGQFQIPANLTVSEERDIFGHSNPITGNSVAVTEAPILLIGN